MDDNLSNCPPIASDVAATLAAERGWHVFPCRADKRPATPHGFQDASSEASTIERLWRDFPGPLIGVATGEVSGIDVLDLDHVKHASAANFLVEQTRWLELVPRAVTRSGGLHFYFQHHPGLKCSVGRPVAGVDVRADGGYVIWWAVRLHPEAGLQEPIPPWPLPLLEVLRPPPPVVALRVHDNFPGDMSALLRMVEKASTGQRNSMLFWASCRAGEMVRKGTISRSEAERWLIASAVWAGLSEREAHATVRSGLERAA